MTRTAERSPSIVLSRSLPGPFSISFSIPHSISLTPPSQGRPWAVGLPITPHLCYSNTSMFGIGLPELIIIIIVALLVVGPTKLPEVARSLGRALGEFRRMADDVKETIEQEMNVEDEKGGQESAGAQGEASKKGEAEAAAEGTPVGAGVPAEGEGGDPEGGEGTPTAGEGKPEEPAEGAAPGERKEPSEGTGPDARKDA